jgi:hypothetical protein
MWLAYEMGNDRDKRPSMKKLSVVTSVALLLMEIAAGSWSAFAIYQVGHHQKITSAP